MELISGRGLTLEPPPGRVLIAGPRHTFADLAEAVNAAFARWDLAHLHEFRLPDGRRVGPDEDEPSIVDEAQLTVASALNEGDEFDFIFDFGDNWTHRCRVAAVALDPREEAGITPRKPVSIWGWGSIPDQYGRETDEDGWVPQRSTRNAHSRP